ncbi:MAG TPA: TolC family protein [Planctomycetota bacterium]|jgi:outer membrane protein|nr:TolC family protein [Planctomycetota bacterium]
MERKGSLTAALALAALGAGCAGTAARDRALYERVLFEDAPAGASREEALRAHRELSSRDALSLEDLYRMALHRSETLALAGEELVRIRTRYEQVVGSVLPRLTFEGTVTFQERVALPGATSVDRNFTDPRRSEYRFAARQPIFSGLAEFYELRRQGRLYEAQEETLRHARLLLYADVADAFYAVLQLDRERATVEDALRLARERLEELAQRQRLGISRRSEVLAQEAEVASLEASRERLRGALSVAWEALGFLAGFEGTRNLVDTRPEPSPPPPVERFLARALAGRRDLRALERRVEAARQAVGVARAGYFPVVDLESRYYTHREGFSEDVTWDVALSFEIPIFEGGVTQARLREARSAVRSAELELDRLRRAIDLDVRRAWIEVGSLLQELRALEAAVRSAEENYDLVQAEYRRGIVPNLEVLAAFTTLQQARLARDRARYQAKTASVRLAVQSGLSPGDAP